MKKLEQLTDRKIATWLYLIVFIMIGLGGVLLDVTLVVDELGTLANSAYLAGNTWTGAIEAQGGFYYKYGTAFLYYPFVALFENSFIMYKMILVLQSAIISTTVIFAYYILRRHLLVSSKVKSAVISLTVALMPSVLLYTYYTRADFVLYITPWVLIYLFLECSKAREVSKRRFAVLSSLIAFSSVYAYMSHTRGIALVLAAVVTVIAIRIFLKVKPVHYGTFTISLVLALIADRLFTTFFKLGIWGAEGAKHASAESFNFKALKMIFTKDGLSTMIKLIVGWIFNICTSTAGLVAIGFVAGVMILWFILSKKKQINEQEGIVTIFSMVTFGGTFAMSILFFFQFVHALFLRTALTRADRAIYDRYIVGTVGILCLLGLYIISEKKEWFRGKAKTIAFVGFGGSIAFFAMIIGKYIVNVSFTTRYAITMNTFLDMGYGVITAEWPDIISAYTMIAVISLTVMLVFLFLVYKQKFVVACTIVLAFLLVLFGTNYYKVRYSRNDVVKGRCEEIIELVDGLVEIADEYPVILVNKGSTSIKTYQVAFKNFNTIKTAQLKKMDNVTNLIMISRPKSINYNYFEDDYYAFEDITYSSKGDDIVYIKGEQLKNKLEELGYSMKKMELPEKE